MASENVELVRRAIEAWNRRDLDTALAEADREIELDWSRSIGPHHGIYRGHDDVRRFWETFLEAWDEFRWDPDEYLEPLSDTVVLVNRVRGRGRASGLEVDATGAQVWTVRNSTIMRVELHQTKEDALASLEVDRPSAGS